MSLVYFCLTNKRITVLEKNNHPLERNILFKRIKFNYRNQIEISIDKKIEYCYDWGNNDILNILINNKLYTRKLYKSKKSHKCMFRIIKYHYKELGIKDNDILKIEILNKNSISISKYQNNKNIELILKCNKNGISNLSITIPHDIVKAFNFNRNDIIHIMDINNGYNYNDKFKLATGKSDKYVSYRVGIRAKLMRLLNLKTLDYVNVKIIDRVFIISKHNHL